MAEKTLYVIAGEFVHDSREYLVGRIHSFEEWADEFRDEKIKALVDAGKVVAVKAADVVEQAANSVAEKAKEVKANYSPKKSD